MTSGDQAIVSLAYGETHSFKVDRSTGALTEAVNSPLAPTIDYGSLTLDSAGQYLVGSDDATNQKIVSFVVNPANASMTHVTTLLVGGGGHYWRQCHHP